MQSTTCTMYIIHTVLLMSTCTCIPFIRTGSQHGRCVPFIVAGEQVGLVPEKVVAELIHYPDVFTLEMSSPGGVGCVQFAAPLHDYKTRSNAIASMLKVMRKANTFLTLDGWRDEVRLTCT